MPYQLSAVEGADYVRVDWYGTVSDAEHVEARTAAVKFAMERGIANVLVDLTGIENRANTSTLFANTVAHVEGGMPRMRVALLGTTSQSNDLNFVGNVAAIRGYPMRCFTDVNEAIGWLEGEESQSSDSSGSSRVPNTR